MEGRKGCAKTVTSWLHGLKVSLSLVNSALSLASPSLHLLCRDRSSGPVFEGCSNSYRHKPTPQFFRFVFFLFSVESRCIV